MAGAEGEDRGLAGAPPPVVPHALLLGQRHQARRGHRERRGALHRLPLPLRQASRYGLPAPDGAGLECQRGDDPRLAGRHPRRAAGQVDCRDRLERLSRRAASRSRQLPGRADQDPQKPQRPPRAAAQGRHPSHPPRRTPGCCPHGGQGGGAGRKSQLSRSPAGSGGRRAGVGSLLHEKWRKAQALHDRSSGSLSVDRPRNKVPE